MSLQKGRGTVQARSKADEGRAVLKYIDVEDLVPSEDNFYSMSAIEELAALIELSGGVKQPGLVVPLGGGKYKIIAGHRRRLASLQLVKQGKEVYRKMPCMVEDNQREPGQEADELRAIDEAILLITTNGQREKTDWDKVQEATRLRALLDRKRQFEKVPGETRKIIAEQLGTTPAQVGRYDSIEKHLIPAFKDWLEQERIGISVAYELSMLPEDVQEKAAAECWGKRGPVTLEDVRRWKEQAEKLAESERTYKPAVYVREEKTNKINPAVPEQTGGATMVMADEIMPAPTEEQMEEILERAKDRSASGAVVLPARLEDEAGAPKVDWTPEAYTGDTGKIVDFPAPPSPKPAEDAPEPEKEPLSKQQAATRLEDLKEYCEECMGSWDCVKYETWIEWAEALDVAIAALRK